MCGIARREFRLDGGQPDVAARRPRPRRRCTARGAGRLRRARHGARSPSAHRPPQDSLTCRSGATQPDGRLRAGSRPRCSNGCIYNYRELRSGARRRRVPVLLPGPTHRGDPQGVPTAGGAACVERPSMRHVSRSAVAERDQPGSSPLGRDRLLGIKPLYTTLGRHQGRIRFASSLPALLDGRPTVDTSIDPVALPTTTWTFHFRRPRATHEFLPGRAASSPRPTVPYESDPTACGSEHVYWRPETRPARAGPAGWSGG